MAAASDKSSSSSSGGQGDTRNTLRTRSVSKKRSLGSSSPGATKSEISPEKRLKSAVDEPVVVQGSKCLDYLFKLDEHAAATTSGADLKDLDLDMIMCKDCLEQLNAVITKAKKMLLPEGDRKDRKQGSCGSPSQSSSEMAETFSDDISSSSSSSSSSCSSASQTTNAATAAACDQRRSKLKSLILSVMEATDHSSADDCDCRFVGWRKLLTNRIDRIKENGFLELNDARESDMAIWQVANDLQVTKPSSDDDPAQTNENELIAADQHLALNQKVFKHISAPFRELLAQETQARRVAVVDSRSSQSQLWKRQMSNARELCDICNTAIFNGHYGCTKCGLAVCLECMSNRRVANGRGDMMATGTPTKKTPSSANLPRSKLLLQRDSFDWPHCVRLNLKSLVFLLSDKYPSATSKTDRSSFNIRYLSQMVAHSPTDLVFIQLIPPSILDSVQNCFEQVQARLSTPAPETDDQPPSSGSSNDLLVLDVCSTEVMTNGRQLLAAFDANWERQKPIVFRNLHRQMDSELWKPEAFSKEFGHLTVDLVNCRNHFTVPNVSMERFWLGFEDETKRPFDSRGVPMILKLKDWPNSDEFKKVLPSRFKDLMANLPVKAYTSHEGFFNMASSLTDSFLKPDLGPKLYIAYSSAKIAKEGTTNLHVDISDAFNLMMYVGQEPTSGGDDDDDDDEVSSVDLKSTDMYQILVESKCDQSQLNRFLSGERPGALWHLFHPKDADTIRTFFRAKSKLQIDQERDPIHDQINYINAGMLKKLKKNFNVEAFTVVQFLGDAIFIPAGAPHQVRNLNSCIKVAEDFVSPQGIEQCLRITSQLRLLSKKHLNHEDKLQIKNILYHKMKDCLSFFTSVKNW